MASGMLNGDRRWAPTRKGMTVLGKVPKPINLPSQRLENHGMDPNVEIVPKGTLTWGSRPSPTTPNAWGLSSHSSPNADGSVDSSIHFNGRPSSSGSGTRPSTGGSDHPGEHVASAWKSNCRPSSASGVLVSNQTQLSARPQSSETRPGSSQLSRFADSAIGHSGPWGSAGIAQKLSPASPGTKDFCLSSGEFPTLGSEKSSYPHYEPESHASILNAPTTVSNEENRLEMSQSGDEKIDIHSGKGNVNSWKSETTSTASDNLASITGWHENLHNMQLVPNISPAQSLSNPWHGTSRNPSDGVWCGGVASAGSYRSPSTSLSGDYQSNPFTYHPSQIPGRLDPNLHCAPRAVGHPTGYQNENREGFMVPTMPIIPVRSGVYHGPGPYDGPYVPAGFGGPNVRERSVMGCAPGPPVFGKFPNQNFHQVPVRMPLRSNGPAQSSDDKIENIRQHEFASGQYKVLLKHHNPSVGVDSEGSRDQTLTSTDLSLGKNDDLEVACGQAIQQKVMQDELKYSKSGESLHFNNLQGSSQPATPATLSVTPSDRAVDNMIKKGVSSRTSEINHLTTKNSKLIEKIETLNNKARVTEGRLEGPLPKIDNTKRADDDNATHGNLRNSVPSNSLFDGSSGIEPLILKSTSHSESAVSSKTSTLECRSVKASVSSKANASTFSVCGSSDGNTKAHASTFSVGGSSDGNTKAHADYRRNQNMHGKGGHISKFKMDGEEKNRGTKQLPRKDSLAGQNGNTIHDVLPTEESGYSQDHSDRLGPLHTDKPVDEPYMSSPSELIDYKAQRAKMKEIAMQRAKQLQEEEEERNREQKAKALAKLEELNRRTLFEISNKDAEQMTSSHRHLQSIVSDSPHPDANMDHSVGCNSISSSETWTEHNARGNTIHGVETVKTSGDGTMKHNSSTLPLTSKPDGNSDRATLKDKNDPDMCNLEGPNLLLAGQLPDMSSSKRDVNETGKNKGTKPLYIDSSKEQCCVGLTASVDKIVASKNGPADSLKKNNIQYQDNNSSKKRQTSHRRKQNIPGERNLEDKAVAHVDIASSEILMEAATETALCGKLISIQSNETCNTSTQQRRNERNSKNKTKSEEALEITDLTSAVLAKGILEKPVDICLHSQKSLEDGCALSFSKTEKTGTSQNFREIKDSSNLALLQAAGGSVKVTNNWKSNPSRRPSRNVQPRSGSKFQGSDNVVWAPVRSSKGETTEESQDSQGHAHVMGNCYASSTGIEDPVNVKSRRAEMQRYVPKVVVKDALQVGNLQIPNCQTPDETSVTDKVVPNDTKEHGITESDSVTVRKNAEHTLTNRHGKSYGASASWRQRNSQDESVDSAATGISLPGQKQLEDASSSSQGERSVDILITSNDMPKESMVVSDLKEQGNTTKSRRHIPKVHKVVPADAKGSTSEITDKFEPLSLVLDYNGTHVKRAAAESLSSAEHAKSQWKPKSRTVSSHGNQQGTASGGEKFASQIIIQDKESSNTTNQHARAPVKPTEMDERRHQLRRERKEIPQENHNGKACHDDEHHQGLQTLDLECQQPVRHMKGKDMRYSGRFHKGQDNSYEDTGRQNFPFSGDRQSQTSHYEYQRIEARNSGNQFQSLASSTKDVPSSAATGQKFREKAQGHKKGGTHCYARSNASYQDGTTSGQQS